MSRQDIDDLPFIAFGARGCFAYSLLSNVTDDGVRATWTVVPALPGVQIRPRPKGGRGPHGHVPNKDDVKLAESLVVDCCSLYLDMLRKRLPSHARSWEDRIKSASSWSGPMQQARFAYYGGPYCDGRLDVGIHDALRARNDRQFMSMSATFGHLVWNFSSDNAFWTAKRCGEFIAKSFDVVGEAGWDIVERAMKS